MDGTCFSHLFWARSAFVSAVLFFAAAAVLTLLAVPERLPKVEPLPRNRWIGLFGGWIALAICVPHAVVVSPDFLLPLLWPLAVTVPLLGFFFVDYPAARAVGGLLILQGYALVHYPFDFSTPGFPVLAVTGWLAGIAGIWISAQPCVMRDYLRLAARSAGFRFSAASLWGVAALLGVWALVATREGAGA